MENNRKKILFVITQSEFGGAQHYVWEIARSLNPAVYDVVVAAGPEGDNELGLLSQLQKIGVRTIHLKNLRRAINPIFDILTLGELKKIIEQEKPDVLFLNSTKAGFLGSFTIKVNPSMKIIYRIGGWAFNEDITAWQKKLYLFLEKYTAKRKDLIIVNSNVDRDIAVRLGIAAPEKIITIYNGLDRQGIKFLDQKEARLSLRLLTSSGIVKNQNTDWWVSRKIIGAVANLYKTKGLRYFIEAAAIVRKNYPEALFFIIGEGRERAELEALIIKNRLRDNFLLLGGAPSARIYLKAFDVFVLPSVKEGMPWAILEAMAAEVPIVATSVGGVPEMIGAMEPRSGPSTKLGEGPSTWLGAGLLAPPKDPQTLAGAIVYLLKNPVAGQALAAQAKQILIDKFSFREMLKKTEAAINL